MKQSLTAGRTRAEISRLIFERLRQEAPRLQADFHLPGRIPSCSLDDLLPPEIASEIYSAFPSCDQMMERKSLREHKYVAAQMDRYHPLLEEIIFAFQQDDVVKIVGEITGIRDMSPDRSLYAGGISLMAPSNFLNPHLDNSHNKDRQLYRVLNLLYYVSPDWESPMGGNLELWDQGPEGKPREIVSRFNRLVLMGTDEHSWHSVNQVKASRNRCCISNYYFSPHPLGSREYFHITSFRGRPEQPLRDVVLKADAALRMGVRKVVKDGIFEVKQIYKKDAD